MELNILWMYHNIKDVFGDAGNIQALKKRLEMRHIDCHIKTCTIGEQVNMCEFDLIYIGTNISYKDTFVYDDLMKRKDDFQKAFDRNIFFLLVSGGFQMFGSHFISEDGSKLQALNFFDYYTDYHEPASSVQNVCIESTLSHQRIIGFENHTYQIFNSATPLGKVIMGNGNNHKDHDEGFMNDHVIATNLHGPLLPKNPELTDFIIEKALSRIYHHIIIEPQEDLYEEKARDMLLKRWGLTKS